LPNIL